MEPFVRKAPPDCLRLILRHMHTNRSSAGQLVATIEQLIHVLSNANYNKLTATEAIHNAIQDGLLIPIVKSPYGDSPRKRLHENKMLRLPELNEVPPSEHDFYCYECHLPGMLEFCKQCPRSFHRICYRRDAERPNYTVPSAKQQRNPLPVFSSETGSDSENEGEDGLRRAASTIADYESDAMRASSSLQADQSSLASFTPQHLEESTIDSTSSPIHVMTSTPDTTANICLEDKPTPLLDDYSLTIYDTKTKLEVVCLGEVRPPNRKRPAAAMSTSNVSYKSEVTLNDDDLDLEKELCTCCRILKSAATRNPANIEPNELCHLLNFTFSRNRSWIAQDAPSYLEILKLTAKERNVIVKLLFKVTAISLDTIAHKLRKKKYIYLMQFLVDILDVQHNIGVLFGRYSTALDSTKYFMRDIVHDLSEIRRCPDCFRYSHEKRSNIWFAKPCVQRHELVFAKHSGFSYWPAKVIRVLPNNKYDVRFFGGKHSRALIDVKFIKPIDSESKQLKLGNSLAIRKALEELRYHQILSTYPPSNFSFYANKEETAKIIRDVLGRCETSSYNITAVSGRKRRTTIVESAINENVEGNYPVLTRERKYGQSDVLIADTKKRITRSKRTVKPSPTLFDLKKTEEELAQIRKIAEIREKQNVKLRSQMQNLKETLKKYEIEKKILKRKQWCYWCLEEAIYLCCFKAAYCSNDCQSRHWVDGHNKVCKNKDNHRLH